jgi:methionine aminotransferase
MQHISKLPNVGTTIFSVMSALATKHHAINLSQGFPDFGSDQKLIDLVSKAMNSGYNHYAPMLGNLELREAIAKKFDLLYNTSYHPENEITITAGATQAIFTIITTFIKLNDEVIIFKPAYDSYQPAIELNGGKSGASISAKTTFLIAGANMGPAKLQKATDLGVTLLSENEFIKLISQ